MKNKASMLIVEDELLPAEYLKQILEKEGYIVLEIVETGKEAIEKTVELKPDIVLMDIMLKDDINGCKVASVISTYENKPIIIFLTAYKDQNIPGCDAELDKYPCILKPYKEMEILTTIEQALTIC